MKKSILLGTCTVWALASYAQHIRPEQVPAVVKQTLALRFPAAKTVKWEKETTCYEAGFEAGGVEYSVELDATGAVLETENEIPVNKLPAAASAYLSQTYPGQKVKEAAQIIDAKGVLYYEAELKNIDVIFGSDGQFIKTVKHEKG